MLNGMPFKLVLTRKASVINTGEIAQMIVRLLPIQRTRVRIQSLLHAAACLANNNEQGWKSRSLIVALLQNLEIINSH